jgi:phosphoribosyl 1,2-cyclic phosphodiesterase
MHVRCWGARGSIPVCGAEYLRYGGSTTCLEIRAADGSLLVVDAGSGVRRLGAEILERGEDRIHLLFTHAHWDHILGFPFFRPLYRDGIRIDIYGYPFAQASVRDMIARMMSPPYFPVKVDDVKAALEFHGDWEEPVRIGSVTVRPIRLSHPGSGLGYRFEEDGRSFVFLTDNELAYEHPGGAAFEDYVAFARDADVLFHDAEFRPEEYEGVRTWGHSTWADALRLALEAGVRRFGLFHHNQDRSDDGVDELVEAARDRAADCGADLECFAAAEGMAFDV